MTKATFNQVQLEIPEGWVDATTVTLLGPQPSPAVRMLPQSEPTHRPSIVLRRSTLESQALEQYADEQEKNMRACMLALEVVGRGTVETVREGASREFTFGPKDARLRQLHLYLPVDEDLLILCATGFG